MGGVMESFIQLAENIFVSVRHIESVCVTGDGHTVVETEQNEYELDKPIEEVLKKLERVNVRIARL
jgi:hypothetical protein